jgi:hypothetical protein
LGKSRQINRLFHPNQKLIKLKLRIGVSLELQQRRILEKSLGSEERVQGSFKRSTKTLCKNSLFLLLNIKDPQAKRCPHFRNLERLETAKQDEL